MSVLAETYLILKFAALFERRILLFVYIDQLLALNEELASCGDALAGYGVDEGFRKWGEAFWWVDDECWVDTLGLDVLTAELVEEVREGWVFGDREREVGKDFADLFEGYRVFEVGEFAVDSFFDAGDEVDAAEGGCEVGCRWVECACYV
jgi:hypothetical protein